MICNREEDVARRFDARNGYTCREERGKHLIAKTYLFVTPMEFPFDVNAILPYEVTIINGDCRVLNRGQTTRIAGAEKLTMIIDEMGDASYKAQGLSGPVTTARKFRLADHRLYIIKKANDNNHLGSVLGILKVGAKHLYIYDTQGQVHERTPLCVLDFYVIESKQRLGYGKRLFDTMLEFEKCLPHELAIDRPSNKCVAFLHKHYQLTAPIYQVNNFVVYPAFFNQQPVYANRKNHATKSAQQEFDSWLFPSQRQQRRPFSEQLDTNRTEPTHTTANEHEFFMNHRPAGLARTNSMAIERNPHSSYTTSYGQHYNQTVQLREQNGVTHSAPYMPRTYSQGNGNGSMSAFSPLTSSHDYQRMFETARTDPATSIYTFPSLMKPSNNWRAPSSSSIDTSSSWRLFGVHRLLN